MTTIERIEIADEPKSWSALGFAVTDDSCMLGTVDLRLTGKGSDGGGGIVRWALRDLASEDLDGLPTEGSTVSAAVEAASAHPNGVVALDHIVAVSPAFERSVSALQAAGLDLRRIREEPTPAGAPRQAFFRLGAEILELVAEPDGVTATKGGPDRPAHFWGLAMLTEDIDATVASMAPHAKEPRPAVQPGRRISTLSRSAGLSVPVALISAGAGAA